MEWRAAWDGISRDVDEILREPVAAVVFALMVALPFLSVWLLMRRRWLAVVPLAISVGVFGAWFLYYATDWWQNPGQGAWLPAFLLMLGGWAVAIVALRR
jgi:hypothetical protein